MLNFFCLGAALVVGQGSPAPMLPVPTENSGFAVDRAAKITTPVAPTLPAPQPVTTMPAKPGLLPFAPSPTPPARIFIKPASMNPPVLIPAPQPAPMGVLTQNPTPMPMPKAAEIKKNGEAKKNGEEPKKNGNGEEKKENGEDKKDEEEKKDDRGYFMKTIDSEYLGGIVAANELKVDGWAAFSYSFSNRNNRTNLPVVWNDRADTALMQQFWVNVEKPLDWSVLEVQHGFKVAFLYGSDYRFTVIRGLFNNQLKNQNPDPAELNGFEQNIYGADIPLFYYQAWLPGVGGEGTEIVVGRMFCQWGYESIMAPATPLMSRSYAFNWAPPFFHVGAMATTKVNQNLTVKNMIVNGNDVWFDGSEEWRYAGQILLTSDDEKQTLALSTSFGRARFNANDPNGPAQGITTIGLAYEPAGRNNLNCFDLVYANKLTDKCTYALEAIYGYQTDVPAAATGSVDNFGGGSGTARWFSVVNYLTYAFDDKLTGIARYEAFYDAEGQRTGFEGLYHAGTLGLQYRPCDEVIIRPEIRYDYNDYSTPFNGRHGIFTAGADVIIKF